MTRALRPLVLLLIALAVPLAARADFETGQRAYDQGDYAAALREWRPAADSGHAGARNALGLLFRDGKGVAPSDVDAVAWFRLAAQQGFAEAENNLGVMVEEGRGTAQSDAEAVRLYRRAAEKKFAAAQSNLGLMYARGRGVARDDQAAVRWFQLAAAQGYAPAQHNLAFMYVEGRGVTQDFAEAVRYYRMAASQGHAAAQNNLGRRYELGQGVAQDDAEAARWYQLAAAQGRTEAQFNLGQLYEDGRGLARDLAEARRLYEQAAAKYPPGRERDDAVKARDRVSAKLAAAIGEPALAGAWRGAARQTLTIKDTGDYVLVTAAEAGPETRETGRWFAKDGRATRTTPGRTIEERYRLVNPQSFETAPAGGAWTRWTRVPG